MTYYLYFSLEIDRRESCVVYNPERFTDKPIQISVPDVVKIVENFIHQFEKVGIIKEPTNQTISSNNKNQKDIVNNQENESEIISIQDPKPLYGLSGNAYIYKSKSLPKDKLDLLCVELIEYIKKCSSDISQYHFLSEQVNLDISGLKEVIEIRNYLYMYTQSKKKQYQNGYLYITVD
jgi:hypothetical protein